MDNILKKPYSNIQRIEFVSQFSFLEGKKILETNEALYALEQNQTVVEGRIVEDIDYEKNLKETRKKLAAKMSISSSKLERAIYNSKSMDFDDVIEFIKENNDEIDLKPLKIELKNTKIKRSNVLISKMLNILGYYNDDIDNLFLRGKLPKKEGSNE